MASFYPFLSPIWPLVCTNTVSLALKHTNWHAPHALERVMLKRFFENSWLRTLSTFCVVSGIAVCSQTTAFGQHGGGHGGGHSGGSHMGSSHMGSSHMGSSHMGSSHHVGNSYYGGYGGFGGYGLGGISIGIGSYPGFGINSGYGGYGSSYGYGGSRLGYSSLGYSGLGYSGLGYSNYYSAQPSTYYSPSYSSSYVSPQYVAPYVVSRPSVTVQQRNPNVYSGPMSADGQPTGDLRPGMVLPDGSVVVSVGSGTK